jgi:putative acetyltransferase
MADYDPAVALWRVCEGIGLSEADSREGIRRFLRRNPGLSVVAESGGKLTGTALAGHDGRRGFIYHLAVAAPHRRSGVGRKLVAACLKRLRARGIQKCHLVVFGYNAGALAFWARTGWIRRRDLVLMSMPLTKCKSAC